MTHDEMIAVIQAHKEGKQLQYKKRSETNGEWVDAKEPSFAFDYYEFRVKPAEPKKAKMLAWVDADQLFWLRETAQPKWPAVRVPSEDKEIEIPGE